MMEKLQPKLRFPEFDGKWNKLKIGDISKKVNSGKTPLGGESVYTNSGVLFIRSQNVKEDKLDLENKTYISNEVNNTMKNSIVKPNDILLNITGASLGRSCVVPNNFEVGNVNQHVCIIRINELNEPRFIQPQFSSEKGQNIFKSLQVGGGREGLNFESIRSISFSFPSLPEQQKIASFLTTIDDKISNLKQKVSRLEKYKKGVMQQIFSQQIRFKDTSGNDYPEWEEKSLGDIAVRITQKNQENNLNVLTISAQFGLISQLSFFNKSVSAKNLSGYYLLSKNDFAYNKSYSNGYPMGAIKRLNKYDKGVVSTLYICFRFNHFVDFSFMEHYFETGLQNKEIEKIAQEGARNHGLLNISVKDFFSITMIIPTLKEQTEIAEFLTGIDKKIETTKLQLSKMEVWKKGLLQGMFC